MIGSICGDVIGSRFEKSKRNKLRFFFLFNSASRFTDDTVLTVSVADAIMNNIPYDVSLRKYARLYPYAGYGKMFKKWVKDDNCIGDSYGNGAAMRVAPIGWAFEDMQMVMDEACLSALPSHNHPEGIAGAQAAALAVYLARKYKDKAYIKNTLKKYFDYNLDLRINDIPSGFYVSCSQTMPICFSVFFNTNSFVSAIRTAVKLGGDVDTNAAIVGAIAEAFYGGVPRSIVSSAKARLDDYLLQHVNLFTNRYVRYA